MPHDSTVSENHMRYIKTRKRHQTFNQTIQAHMFGLYGVWPLGLTSHYRCQQTGKFGRTETAFSDFHEKLTGKRPLVAPNITN